MSQIGRYDLLMLLIHLEDPSSFGLGGMTRIQKLLYLLDAEEGIRPGADGFKFEAYKAGPYSPRVYDDLELLENMSYIRRATGASSQAGSREKAEGDFTFEQLMGSEESEASDPEKAEVDFTFEQLMGPEDVMAPKPDEMAPTADSYEETRYFLTDIGKKKVEELLKKAEYKPFVNGIRKVKSRFAKYSLNDLLYYVYTRYPGMTTESEIKEKVLRRRPT